MTPFRRWPVVAALGALLAGSVFLDQVPESDRPELAAGDVVKLRAQVADPLPLTTSWYCSIGSSSAQGYADHTVHVSNVGDEPARATLSVLTDSGPGPTVRIDLAARATESLKLSTISAAENAGVVVEIVGGEGVVGHEVSTEHGTATGPCATTVSGSWYLAGGSTRRDSDQFLALMNPFGEDVVLDVTFRTATRERRPEALTALVIPGRSVVVVNVSEYVSIEPVVATTITTIQGRVAAEQLQVANGELGPRGAALVLGTPAPATEWWLPAGRVTDSGDHQLVVFNPGEERAEIEIYFDLSTTDRRGAFGLSAIELSIQPGRFESLDVAELLAALEIPLPLEFGLRVRSDNDVAVLASRSQMYPAVDNTLVGAEDDGATIELTAPDDQSGEGETADGTPPAGDDAAEATIDPSTIERRDPLGGGLVLQDDDRSSEAGDVAVDAAGADPFIDIFDDGAQPAAGTGLGVSAGQQRLSDHWLIPYGRFLPDGGTVLLISAPADALVSIEAVVSGQRIGPERVAVHGDTRRVVPLVLPVSSAALEITSSSPVVVEVQAVDDNGFLSVGAGVPVIDR